MGRTWKQQSEGLHGDDIFVLAEGPGGTLLAGSSNGIFRWDGSSWVQAGSVTGQPDPPAAARRLKTKAGSRKQQRRVETKAEAEPVQLRGRVNALQAVSGNWFAATAQDIFRSTDDGTSWTPVAVSGGPSVPNGPGGYRTLAARGEYIFIGRREGMVASDDGGATWHALTFPAGLTALSSLALTPDGTLWAGGREGVFFSRDHGHTWSVLKRLPVVAVNSLTWDSSLNRLMVTCDVGTVIYAVDPRDESWTWWNAGWAVHGVASLGKRLAAASFYSGVVVQPEVETSAKTGGAVQDARR
jgi:hypothetical protein